MSSPGGVEGGGEGPTRPPDPVGPDALTRGLEFVLGTLAGVLLLLGTTMVFVFVTTHLFRWTGLDRGDPYGVRAIATGLFLASSLVTVVAIRTRRAPRTKRRALALGVLLVGALATLISGPCALTVWMG